MVSLTPSSPQIYAYNFKESYSALYNRCTSLRKCTFVCVHKIISTVTTSDMPYFHLCLCYFPRADINYHKLGDLNKTTEVWSLKVQMPRSLDSRCWRSYPLWKSMGAPSLAPAPGGCWQALACLGFEHTTPISASCPHITFSFVSISPLSNFPLLSKDTRRSLSPHQAIHGYL